MLRQREPLAGEKGSGARREYILEQRAEPFEVGFVGCARYSAVCLFDTRRSIL